MSDADTGSPRYRLDSRIAVGGMGEVWRATDTVLGREVAVKVLKAEYADDPDFRARFQAEARHAASLHHPNVAAVFDFGELADEDGSGSPRPFLVMELVPGQPLSVLLRDHQPMPPESARSLVAQAADAVAAAHALDIVHRDIKPANLLVTPDGAVKITDFGIARAADAVALTRTGQILGTPQYLSPEQADGRPATTASDVYALGVVLYECLAGRRPFDGGTPVSTALAHIQQPPPPLPDTVPPQLRAVVDRALAKDPADRFGSAADLASAVRGDPPATRTLGAPPAGAGQDHGRWRARVPWLVAAAAVLVIVGVLATLDRGGDAPAKATTVSDTPHSTSASPTSDTVRVRAEDFVGRPVGEAERALESAGLDTRRTPWANPDGHRAGTVAKVSPTGRLEPGTLVTLSVWADPPKPEPAQPDKGKPKKHGPDHGKSKGKH